LIDPGLDAKPIDVVLQKLQLLPILICCTHGHFDHVGSAAYFQSRHQCPIYIHEADMNLMKSANFLLMAYRLSTRVILPKEVITITQDSELKIKQNEILFHEAPGHTDGSCIIQIGCALFTGDTIYARGVGLSNIPGERPKILRESIKKNWHLLTEDRLVLPGHGSPANAKDVTISNKELIAFLGYSANLD
jgi:glyoxylase-like metal-dependent hydrolase (beta-lactamase superfamily II)